MLHRDWVRGADIFSDNENTFTVSDVVHGVCHCPVTPSISNPGHSGGVTDTGLMVNIVGTPECSKLTQGIRSFVIVMGRT